MAKKFPYYGSCSSRALLFFSLSSFFRTGHWERLDIKDKLYELNFFVTTTYLVGLIRVSRVRGANVRVRNSGIGVSE